MMTPMQLELHEARKERLYRMMAWHAGNVVPASRVRRRLRRPAKVKEAALEPKGLTPIHEIESPTIEKGAELQISQIRQVVAKRYRISLDEIKSDSRRQIVLLPRQIAYTLARRLTSKSLPAIGRAFGGRDHTTVLHGVQKIEKRASSDAEFAAELEQLEKVIIGKSCLPCPCCGSTPAGPDDQN